MATGQNLWSDVSSISNAMLEAADFVIRETYQMQNFVTVRGDMSGGNLRKLHQYGTLTAGVVNEGEEVLSQTFAPSLLATLTPYVYGDAYFVSDLRRDSEAPEDIIRDGAAELAYSMGDLLESHLVGDMASLTGGTIGAAGTAITWGYMAAAIAQARNANKSASVPLSAVIHGYQAAVLAKSASIAGATVAVAPQTQDNVTQRGMQQAFTFLGVPIYQVFSSPNSLDDFTGGVFPRTAIMLDWRKRNTLEAQRDAKKIGTDFVMSGSWAHGVWKPALGIKMVFDATAPTS